MLNIENERNISPEPEKTSHQVSFDLKKFLKKGKNLIKHSFTIPEST